jgi:hypothetical protein
MKRKKKKHRNQSIIIESSAKGNTMSYRMNPHMHAQGAQDVMKIPGASSCPIQEFASLVRQPDLRLQSVMQA